MNYLKLEMKLKYFNSYVLSCFLFFLCFYGVHYTADWEGYEYYFEHGLQFKGDLAFTYISQWFQEKGCNYIYVYRFHILLMALFYPLLFSRFNCNLLIVTIVFIVSDFVLIANQIRYYVAFPLALFSIYYLIYHKNYFLFTMFLLLALLFHQTTVLLIVVVIVYYLCFKNIFANNQLLLIIILNLIIWFGSNFLDVIMPKFNSLYANYLYEESRQSSFFGGFYSEVPFLISYFLIFRMHSLVSKIKVDIIDNKMYLFLFILSISTSSFVLLGFQKQELIRRFMGSFVFLWFVFFIYCSKIIPHYIIRFKVKQHLIIILIVILSWKTFVPYLLGIHSSMINEEALKIIESISFIE